MMLPIAPPMMLPPIPPPPTKSQLVVLHHNREAIIVVSAFLIICIIAGLVIFSTRQTPIRKANIKGIAFGAWVGGNPSDTINSINNVGFLITDNFFTLNDGEEYDITGLEEVTSTVLPITTGATVLPQFSLVGLNKLRNTYDSKVSFSDLTFKLGRLNQAEYGQYTFAAAEGLPPKGKEDDPNLPAIANYPRIVSQYGQLTISTDVAPLVNGYATVLPNVRPLHGGIQGGLRSLGTYDGTAGAGVLMVAMGNDIKGGGQGTILPVNSGAVLRSKASKKDIRVIVLGSFLIMIIVVVDIYLLKSR